MKKNSTPNTPKASAQSSSSSRSASTIKPESKAINVLITSVYSKDEHDILVELSALLTSELAPSHNLTIKSRLDIDNEEFDVFFAREGAKADIIIVLISTNLLTSIFINEGSFADILKSPNHFIIPVLTQKCLWQDMEWITGIVPRSGTPLAVLSREQRNEEYQKIFRIISTISEGIVQKAINIIDIQRDIKVFISHSHDDGDFADLLKRTLKEHRINSWVDVESILLGDEWASEIDYGIEKSDAVIVILSPSSRKSEYVTYEWAYALGKKKIVLPIKLKDGDCHPILNKKQHLDFSKRGLRPWNELVRQIKESVIKNESKKTKHKI